MSCAISPYPYSSLLPDSIRLLRLLPSGDGDAPVQCQLFSYCRQEVSHGNHLYEALSYVWGDENKTLPIFIGTHCFDVTENLYAALSRLRDHSLERVIWVDAICINQGNEEEKEKQIQLMARIYGQAYSVVVWLGKEADDSDVALKAIISAGSDRDLKFIDDATVQQAVIKLLERKWFQHIWVLQEVAAARHIRIVWVALKPMDMPFV
ncbi:HET-domain-containing protein [Ophiobolus disseminans]|uniref:HET-domain-containing protein n=1 Tax=Ophiobolus disseminans TaxID=1469910 RepID=A0A6A6ZXJ4_9PLEO|nr:HET-domain-containing protein [Ophiobolus disseminans]